MHNLREQLHEILQGRVCVVGVGNVELGDDGVGVRLAEAVQKSEIQSPKSEGSANLKIRSAATRRGAARFEAEVIVAHTSPERYLSHLSDGGFDNVIFLDAVECGAEPGEIVLLDSAGMAARFPQVSTHKLSLGLLARMIEANGGTKCWLLGVQPSALKAEARLSPRIQASLQLLAETLCNHEPNRSVAPAFPTSDFGLRTSDFLVPC
jgi:hydrogenase maturation protease